MATTGLPCSRLVPFLGLGPLAGGCLAVPQPSLVLSLGKSIRQNLLQA